MRILFVFGGLALLMATATALFLLVKIPYIRAQRLKQMKADYRELQSIVVRQDETIQTIESLVTMNEDIDRPLANLVCAEIQSHYSSLRKADINTKDLLR